MSDVPSLLSNPFFDMDVFFCVALGLGAILWCFGYRTWGIRLVLVVLVPFFILTLTPCGSWLLMRLENLHEERLIIPEGTEGMILLGGGVAQIPKSTRGQPIYGSSMGRVFEALRLAHQYPSLKILLTGTPSEVTLTKSIFEQHQIDPTRLIEEDCSFSTEQNAQNSFALVKPGKRPWLLVTSAFHMNRAVGVFEKNGWNVIPYPVDYKSGGTTSTLRIGKAGREDFWIVSREWLASKWYSLRRFFA